MSHLAARSLYRLAAIATCLTVALPVADFSDATSAGASTQIAPCQGSDLWGAYISTGAATGNYIYNIAIINIGHTTCRLSGYPRIQGTRGSRTYDLQVARHGTFAGNLSPTVLAPRMIGELILSVADNCNALNTGGITKINEVAAANTYSNLTLKMPGAAGDVYLSGFKVDIACGLDVSRLGWNTNSGQ
jgi:hypothetical protein